MKPVLFSSALYGNSFKVDSVSLVTVCAQKIVFGHTHTFTPGHTKKQMDAILDCFWEWGEGYDYIPTPLFFLLSPRRGQFRLSITKGCQGFAAMLSKMLKPILSLLPTRRILWAEWRAVKENTSEGNNLKQLLRVQSNWTKIFPNFEIFYEASIVCINLDGILKQLEFQKWKKSKTWMSWLFEKRSHNRTHILLRICVCGIDKANPTRLFVLHTSGSDTSTRSVLPSSMIVCPEMRMVKRSDLEWTREREARGRECEHACTEQQSVNL